MVALVREDGGYLKMVPQTLNESCSRFIDFIYWEDLEDKPRNRGFNDSNLLDGACTVMQIHLILVTAMVFC